MQTVSTSYADFVLSTCYDKLEPETIQQAKKLILDLMGVALAGYQSMRFPRLVVEYMEFLGGPPESTLIQKKKKLPAINAVFANAACAHAIDMDDGHRLAASHPGTVIIPTALSTAELCGASAEDLITGVVVGYEIMIRVGAAINPSSLNRGFHATGVTGTFGAAATAASVMKLDRAEIIGALGMAGLQSAGMAQVNYDAAAAEVKPLNPARAAAAGLLSCILARKGARGPVEIFEGESGFLKGYADSVDQELLTRDLGKTFEICNAYIKLYAACRHVHACIDAALEVARQNPVEIDQIKKIYVETYAVAARFCGITDVTTPSAGRFSIPYSVALALVRGKAGANEFSKENIEDKGIQALSKKVEVSIRPEWEKRYPNKRGATVRIKDKNNNEWSAQVELAKGEPENPASWEEIYDKFYINATSLISDEAAKKLGEVILNLENSKLTDITELI